MKKRSRYFTIGLLIMTLFLTMTINRIKAVNESYLVHYNEQDSIYDKENNRTFTLYFDIPKEANNYQNVEINLGEALVDAISAKISMPGDYFNFNIVIRNNSGVNYQYINESLYIQDPYTQGEGKENSWGIKSFSGSLLEESLVPYRTANLKAIYKALFHKSSQSEVTGMDMVHIYDTLAALGYTQEDALTQYILDYYNNVENGYNTDNIIAKHISELDVSALRNIFSTGVNMNATYKISDVDYATLTAKQKENLQRVGEKNEYRLRETEKELAEYYYNYFYDWCVGLQFGSPVTYTNANGELSKRTVSTSSIMKLYNDENQVRSAANEYIKEQFDQSASGSETKLIAGYTLDGPLTGNNAQYYEFGFETSIKLERVISTGTVTVHKKLDLNGYETNDRPTFLFKLTDSQGVEHIQAMSFNEKQNEQTIVFTDIPLGQYTIEEIDSIRYESVDGNLKEGNLTSDHTVEFVNKKVKDNDFSDNQVVVNHFQKDENQIKISQTYH